MKNQFVKNNIPLNKPKKRDSNARNRKLAFVLLAFMVFWTIGSILGTIALFRNSAGDKTAYADTTAVSVYRDSFNINPSTSVIYRHYQFSGQPNENFASPFRIELHTNSSVEAVLFLRFEGNVTLNPQFSLFYNSKSNSKNWTRTYYSNHNCTYYLLVLNNAFMSSIVNTYGQKFTLMQLEYDFSSVFDYEFDLFVSRGVNGKGSPLFYEGFLDSNSYSDGFVAGLNASDVGVFFNGYGTLTYSLKNQSNNYTISFNPTNETTYFNQGRFLFSQYLIDRIGSNNIFNLDVFIFTFTLNRELVVSSSNFLVTDAFGSYSSGQSLGLSIRYYNYERDTGQSVLGGTTPVVNIVDSTPKVDNQFWTYNNDPTLENGVQVNRYYPVDIDTFVITLNYEAFNSALSKEGNTFTLGFPTGYYQGYLAGFLDAENSFDTDYFYDLGIDVGKEFAEAEYQRGLLDGARKANDYSFFGLLSAVVDAPLHALRGMLNFEILGFNLMSLFSGLITLALIIFVVRLMLGGK